MIFKIINRTNPKSIFILMPSFMLVILIGLSPDFAAAQDMPKVNLFEFSLNTSDEKDKQFKNAIQNKIMDKLNQSQKIKKLEFEFIDDDILSMLGSKEDYMKQAGIRYIINGRMESRPGERMWIKVELEDRARNNKQEESIAWESYLKKGVDMYTWFERVSHYISSIIEGTLIREVVFTYCFETIGEEDETVKWLRLHLPRRLKSMLEEKDFDDQYTIETLRQSEVNLECGTLFERELEIYEYVISGRIKPKGETEMVEILVEVTVKDQEKTMKSFIVEKTPEHVFYEKIAEYILNQWHHVVEK